MADNRSIITSVKHDLHRRRDETVDFCRVGSVDWVGDSFQNSNSAAN